MKLTRCLLMTVAISMIAACVYAGDDNSDKLSTNQSYTFSPGYINAVKQHADEVARQANRQPGFWEGMINKIKNRTANEVKEDASDRVVPELKKKTGGSSTISITTQTAGESRIIFVPNLGISNGYDVQKGTGQNGHWETINAGEKVLIKENRYETVKQTQSYYVEDFDGVHVVYAGFGMTGGQSTDVIQGAIYVAAKNGTGNNIVLVRGGNDIWYGDANSGNSISAADGVRIFGGYDNNGLRDLDATPTVIKGQVDLSYAHNVTLDGFTITSTYQQELLRAYNGADLTISNNRFLSTYTGGYGVAITPCGSTNTLIQNNYFNNPQFDIWGGGRGDAVLAGNVFDHGFSYHTWGWAMSFVDPVTRANPLGYEAPTEIAYMKKLDNFTYEVMLNNGQRTTVNGIPTDLNNYQQVYNDAYTSAYNSSYESTYQQKYNELYAAATQNSSGLPSDSLISQEAHDYAVSYVQSQAAAQASSYSSMFADVYNAAYCNAYSSASASYYGGYWCDGATGFWDYRMTPYYPPGYEPLDYNSMYMSIYDSVYSSTYNQMASALYNDTWQSVYGGAYSTFYGNVIQGYNTAWRLNYDTALASYEAQMYDTSDPWVIDQIKQYADNVTSIPGYQNLDQLKAAADSYAGNEASGYMYMHPLDYLSIESYARGIASSQASQQAQDACNARSTAYGDYVSAQADSAGKSAGSQAILNWAWAGGADPGPSYYYSLYEERMGAASAYVAGGNDGLTSYFYNLMTSNGIMSDAYNQGITHAWNSYRGQSVYNNYFYQAYTGAMDNAINTAISNAWDNYLGQNYEDNIDANIDLFLSGYDVTEERKAAAHDALKNNDMAGTYAALYGVSRIDAEFNIWYASCCSYMYDAVSGFIDSYNGVRSSADAALNAGYDSVRNATRSDSTVVSYVNNLADNYAQQQVDQYAQSQAVSQIQSYAQGYAQSIVTDTQNQTRAQINSTISNEAILKVQTSIGDTAVVQEMPSSFTFTVDTALNDRRADNIALAIIGDKFMDNVRNDVITASQGVKGQDQDNVTLSAEPLLANQIMNAFAYGNGPVGTSTIALDSAFYDENGNARETMATLANMLNNPTEDQMLVMDSVQALLIDLKKAGEDKTEAASAVKKAQDELLQVVANILIAQAIPDLLKEGDMSIIKNIFRELDSQKAKLLFEYDEAVKPYYSEMKAVISSNMAFLQMNNILSKTIIQEELKKLEPSEVDRIIEKIKKLQSSSPDAASMLRQESGLRSKYINPNKKVFEDRVKQMLEGFTAKLSKILEKRR